MKSIRYENDHFEQMSKSIQSNSDMILIMEKALWYARIVSKENNDHNIQFLYNNELYWLPAFSKYKNLLAYITSWENNILDILIEVEKLYIIANSSNEIICNDWYQKSISVIKELKQKYMKSAQQGDAPEPATNADSASQRINPPAR